MHNFFVRDFKNHAPQPQLNRLTARFSTKVVRKMHKKAGRVWGARIPISLSPTSLALVKIAKCASKVCLKSVSKAKSAQKLHNAPK